MDFSWTNEQLERRADATAFALESLGRTLVDDDREGRFPVDDWRACAARGFLGLSVPEEYGGAPLDLLTSMLVMEGLGYGCRDNGLTFALAAQLWTVQLPIVRFGTEEQKRRFLPGLCGGSTIGAHALTEPEAGSDAFRLTTRAERASGGWVLNGTKHLISLAPLADLALIFAVTDPERGRWGISAFLVESSTEGFEAGPAQHKMGLRTVPLGSVHLIDCHVPDRNVLGPVGAGVSISTHSLEYERCSILASQLGAMERQLEESVAFARSRQQFGQPIGDFQSVSNRLADMKVRIEAARLLLYRVAWLKDQGRPAMLEAAVLKLFLSEAFVDSSADALRVRGGAGFLSDSGVERDLRDAFGGILYAGTSDIQRNIIARLLGS